MSSESQPNSLMTDALPDTEDAQIQENSTLEPSEPEYFDGVLVYAQDDYEFAVCSLALMTSILLEDGTYPKIILQEHPKLNVSKIEKSDIVLATCSLVFVLSSKQLSKDHYASYIKEETIADTRLNDGIPWYHRYRVIPLHTKAKKDRDYKIPVGLRAIEPFDVYDDKCKRSRDRLKQLFELRNLLYRKLTVRQKQKQECPSPDETGSYQHESLENQPGQNMDAENPGKDVQNEAGSFEKREVLYDRNQSSHDNTNEQLNSAAPQEYQRRNVHTAESGYREKELSRNNNRNEGDPTKINRLQNSGSIPNNPSRAAAEPTETRYTSSEHIEFSEEGKEVTRTELSDLHNSDLSIDVPGASRREPRNKGTDVKILENKREKINGDPTPHENHTESGKENYSAPSALGSNQENTEGNGEEKANSLPNDSALITHENGHAGTDDASVTHQFNPQSEEANEVRNPGQFDLKDVVLPRNVTGISENLKQGFDQNISNSDEQQHSKANRLKDRTEGKENLCLTNADNNTKILSTNENVDKRTRSTTDVQDTSGSTSGTETFSEETVKTSAPQANQSARIPRKEARTTDQNQPPVLETGNTCPEGVADRREMSSQNSEVETLTEPFARRITNLAENRPHVVKEQLLRCCGPTFKDTDVTTQKRENSDGSDNRSDEETTKCQPDYQKQKSRTSVSQRGALFPLHMKEHRHGGERIDQEIKYLTEDLISRDESRVPQEHDETGTYIADKSKFNRQNLSDEAKFSIIERDALCEEGSRKESKIENSTKFPFLESSLSEEKDFQSKKPCIEHNYATKLRNGDIEHDSQFIREVPQMTNEPQNKLHILQFNANDFNPKDKLHSPRVNREDKFKEPENRGDLNATEIVPVRHVQIPVHGEIVNNTNIIIVESGNVQIGANNTFKVLNRIEENDDKPRERGNDEKEMSPADDSTRGKFETSQVEPSKIGASRLNFTDLSRDGLPSAPKLELTSFEGGPKRHFPELPTDGIDLQSKKRDGQEETNRSSFLCKDVPSHNDLLAGLSNDGEDTEENAFLAESPEKEKKRCFLCCWKK